MPAAQSAIQNVKPRGRKALEYKKGVTFKDAKKNAGDDLASAKAVVRDARTKTADAKRAAKTAATAFTAAGKAYDKLKATPKAKIADKSAHALELTKLKDALAVAKTKRGDTDKAYTAAHKALVAAEAAQAKAATAKADIVAAHTKAVAGG